MNYSTIPLEKQSALSQQNGLAVHFRTVRFKFCANMAKKWALEAAKLRERVCRFPL